jgi:hypothetical protein
MMSLNIFFVFLFALCTLPANSNLSAKYCENENSVFKILNLIKSSKNCGWSKPFESGYQSIKLCGHYFKGQRDPWVRFSHVDYDFKDKTVLDFGCNQGGMLHSLADKIKHGIGVDVCSKCINVGNRIKSFNNSENLDFYTLDLDKDDVTEIKNFLKSDKVDICFILSIFLWVKNWKKVIDIASGISDAILIEVHGSEKQMMEQVEYSRTKFKHYKFLGMSDDDANHITERRLYILSK